VAEQTTAQGVLATTEAKMAENHTAVTEAATKTKEFETAVVQAKAILTEQEGVVSDMETKGFIEKCHLESFQEALQAFEFLRERVSTVPEVEAEKMVVMETSITMDEVNLVV